MQKTKKSVVKRFRMSASGKLFFSRAGRRHLLQTKSAKRRRSLGRKTQLHKTDEYRIKACLPLGAR
jgi:large subunit ribosomal protein L35